MDYSCYFIELACVIYTTAITLSNLSFFFFHIIGLICTILFGLKINEMY